MYQFIFRHLIVRTDAETAHEHTVKALSLAQRFPVVLSVIRNLWGRKAPSQVPARKDGGPLPRAVPGVLGLAAGMDKNAMAIEAWDALGFGFVEIGTVTPYGQSGNEKPRLWRLPDTREVRNAMGFNNLGSRFVASRLRRLRSHPRGRRIIVGANIGKNKNTPEEDAIRDYVMATKDVARWVDYLVINVSSPNTPGLRNLQDVSQLEAIAVAVREQARVSARREVPVLVKIAPDLADEDIEDIADMVSRLGLSGLVATNTTINHAFETGGLSGPCLRPRAEEIIRRLRKRLGPDPIIIGVGGIETAEDARRFLTSGADLVQGLTSFVYQGPAWPGRINREIAQDTKRYWPVLRVAV
ncbi:MAG: quinone-dependent dihydroorotate dehydrogenase [Actinomycetaceae bacterium]|nr:quinone-dependent dihydroorotate dehydrogenase [Actinomycetaceae bacterium]